MNEHLTELQVYELACGGERDGAIERHADECSSCAAEVRAAQRLLANVERLEPAIEAPRGLEGRLLGRLEEAGWQAVRPTARRRLGHFPWVGGLARAAAAAIIFAAGIGAHALWVGTGVGTDPSGDRAAVSSPALDVQRAGTDYVATIARLVADSARLSAADIHTGREVGLAAMAGAAHELRLLRDDSRVSSDLDDLDDFLDRVWSGSAREVGP